jgi:ESF2/ABP1 family protein
MSSKRRRPVEKVETESESSVEEMEEDVGSYESELDGSDLGLSEGEFDDGEVDSGQEDTMAKSRKGLADLIASVKTEQKTTTDASEDGKHKNRGKGVVYLSRIPPAMSPHQLRTLLAPFGEIGRIWIEVPETITQDKSLSEGKAKKMARRMAKEGWVEFERAKKAYKTAKLLHCQPMGTGRFKDDLWSIKYLRDFSWNDLVNQHLHRKKMREQRLRQHLARAKQEATAFLDNRNVQEKLENRKKRPRVENEGEEDGPKQRLISQAKIKAPSSETGLLGNDILSKVQLFMLIAITFISTLPLTLPCLLKHHTSFSAALALLLQRRPRQISAQCHIKPHLLYNLILSQYQSFL